MIDDFAELFPLYWLHHCT